MEQPLQKGALTLLASAMLALSWPGVAAAIDDPLPTDRAGLAELGRRYADSRSLYEALHKRTAGRARLTRAQVPEWPGLYTREGFILNFDTNDDPKAVPTAKLTPEYQKRFDEKRSKLAQEVEYDPLSQCAPPGHPRWLTEPYLREFVVTADQTWLINEMSNDVRRVYTDGRDHPPESDRYPLYEGDSIGFWDGDKLVVHTNQLRAGEYQRTQPHYSEQVETVEIWQHVGDDTVQVDVWVYDPPALIEPWFVQQRYRKVDDLDKRLRIRYWYCQENKNNVVFETAEGGSQYGSFTFSTDAPKQGEAPAIAPAKPATAPPAKSRSKPAPNAKK